jgi:signal transduction histidine kinase
MTLLEARVAASVERKQLHDRERAAYAAVEAANSAKSEFIALVSHELKNPIAAICAYIKMLQLDTSTPLSPSQAQCLQSIDDLSWYMDSLLVDLSDLSQIEMGYLQLQLGPLALRNAVDKASLAVQRAVQTKEQQLTIAVPPDLPPIWADSMRVVQIITNLLSNASKYTPPGGIIALSAHASEPSCIEIVIRDTGIGMSTKDQERIFEKFFRSSEPTARQERGSGLGLHITQQLVEAQGGQIWFESTLGKGTTFHITLPLAESAPLTQSLTAPLMAEVCRSS